MSVLPLAIFNIGSGGKGGAAHAHKSCGGYFISQTPESHFNVVVLVFVFVSCPVFVGSFMMSFMKLGKF